MHGPGFPTFEYGGVGINFSYIDSVTQGITGPPSQSTYISYLSCDGSGAVGSAQTTVYLDFADFTNPSTPLIISNSPADSPTAAADVPFTIGGAVCFAAGTPVLTDQGNVAIDLIDAGMHTISGKQIVSVTKGFTEPTVVLIKKDCLGEGKPVLDTVVTSMHQVLFRGRMTKACDLPGVNIVPWDGQPVYNVELETLDTMVVNNLIVETAYPKTVSGGQLKSYETKCMRFGCNYLQHADIKNNGGTHCCLNCKAGSGEHGTFCMKLEI